MKAGANLVLIVPFLIVVVCLAYFIYGNNHPLNEQEPTELSLVETLKKEATEAYREGYDNCSCGEVRASIFASAIKLFMEDPNVSPNDVLCVESNANTLENFCEIGISDRQSGENNLAELLKMFDLNLADNKASEEFP